MKGYSIGKRIYVGGLGDATITDFFNPDGIEVFLVEEEDETISHQLIPDEHSDKVLDSVKVIPDEPVGERGKRRSNWDIERRIEKYRKLREESCLTKGSSMYNEYTVKINLLEWVLGRE